MVATMTSGKIASESPLISVRRSWNVCPMRTK